MGLTKVRQPTPNFRPNGLRIDRAPGAIDMTTEPHALNDEPALPSSKPPFLRRIQIRNYKSIAFCDVSLEPLTILVGRNASGKSNFLDALAFVRDLVRFDLGEAVSRHGGFDGLFCRTSNASSFSIAFAFDRISVAEREFSEVQYDLVVERTQSNEAPKYKEVLEIRGLDSPERYEFENGQPTNFKDSGIHNDPRHLRAALLRKSAVRRMYFYNILPHQLRVPQRTGFEPLLDHDGRNLARIVNRTRATDPWLVQRASAYLEGMTENVKFEDVLTLGSYEILQFRVFRKGTENSLVFDAGAMSDGTLRGFAALMAVFQADPVAGAPSLVAIEEPETSLYPAAIRYLVDAFDEATLRTQILLTTHSAEMLDNPTLKPENIRVVQMIDGKTVIGPVDLSYREILAKHLNTLGGLERENQLEPDLDDLDRQSELSKILQDGIQ